MAEYFTVNSEESYKRFCEWAYKYFFNHNYVTFESPRIGPDRSLPQNALLHVWLTEFAAFLLKTDKKSINEGILEGTKREAKRYFYKEYRCPWMVHKIRSPFTGEERMDFTSSARWKRTEMFDFLTWLQGFAAEKGLVLESKGEFKAMQRDAYENQA